MISTVKLFDTWSLKHLLQILEILLNNPYCKMDVLVYQCVLKLATTCDMGGKMLTENGNVSCMNKKSIVTSMTLDMRDVM